MNKSTVSQFTGAVGSPEWHDAIIADANTELAAAEARLAVSSPRCPDGGCYGDLCLLPGVEVAGASGWPVRSWWQHCPLYAGDYGVVVAGNSFQLRHCQIGSDGYYSYEYKGHGVYCLA